MGPPPRSLAADAHACIMVWSDPPDTRLRHERPRAAQRAPLELHPDHHQLAGVLGAVKMRPGCADFKHRGFWSGWSREVKRRYFLAGGGREAEFDALWLVAIGDNDKFDKAIADRTYAG